jgi:hypothetical protein
MNIQLLIERSADKKNKIYVFRDAFQPDKNFKIMHFNLNKEGRCCIFSFCNFTLLTTGFEDETGK